MYIFSSLTLAAFIVGTNAQGDKPMKIQYYTDGGCSNYQATVTPWYDYSCYNYDIGGTNSANIVQCPYNRIGDCFCDFYSQANCQGTTKTASPVVSSIGNCASNWGGGWRSMRCFAFPKVNWKEDGSNNGTSADTVPTESAT